MSAHGGLSTSTILRLGGGGEAFTTISCENKGHICMQNPRASISSELSSLLLPPPLLFQPPQLPYCITPPHPSLPHTLPHCQAVWKQRPCWMAAQCTLLASPIASGLLTSGLGSGGLTGLCRPTVQPWTVEGNEKAEGKVIR